MTLNRWIVIAAAGALAVGAYAFAGKFGKVTVGAAAPAFATMDSNGKSLSLADLKGKYVVLEWCNFGCPYVQKHYNSGNMQALQKKYTDKGIVWLTIFSSAPGYQGYYKPDKLNELAKEKDMHSRLIPDPDGTIGRMYDARNTPTMFVINPQGDVVYMGGIDDQPTPDPESLKGAHNYVAMALDQALAGQPVQVTHSRPYGCSIKYKDN